MSKQQPLLSVGTFGVHLLRNPAGTFSFVGTVPEDFRGSTFASYDEGITAFVAWFGQLSTDAKRKHVGNLRNDIFALVMTN